MNKTRSHVMRVFTALTLVASILLYACGTTTTTEKSIEAPFGSTIVIQPGDITSSIGTATCSGNIDDTTVAVQVLGPDELPMENITIYANLSWAPNSVDPALQIWHLFNAEGAPAVVPYRTKTGKSGFAYFTVRVDPSCPATGTFSVFSGPAFQKIDITVT